jgi:hypothetical protein
MLVPRPVRRGSDGWSTLQTLMSIETKVGDRGFWLQTGRVARVSAVVRPTEMALVGWGNGA